MYFALPNGGKVKYIISGKVDFCICDRTDYSGKSRVAVVKKDEILKFVDGNMHDDIYIYIYL